MPNAAIFWFDLFWYVQFVQEFNALQKSFVLHVLIMFFSGCVGVHAFGATWGLIAVGLFARKDHLRYALDIDHQHYGLFYVRIIER